MLKGVRQSSLVLVLILSSFVFLCKYGNEYLCGG